MLTLMMMQVWNCTFWCVLSSVFWGLYWVLMLKWKRTNTNISAVCLVAEMWEQLKTSVKLGCYEYIWIFAKMTANICNNVYLAAIKQAPLNTLRLMRWWSYTSSFSVSVCVWCIWCNMMKLMSWPSYFLNLKERKVLIKYACAQNLGFQNEIRRVQQEKIKKKIGRNPNQKLESNVLVPKSRVSRMRYAGCSSS